MDYETNKKRADMFWAACPYWIQDKFDVNFMEAHLYNLILTRKFLCWTSDYIAKQFMVSKLTIKRMVSHLEEIGLIKKTLLFKGNRKKWILVALYDKEGVKPLEEINKAQKEGFITLQKYSMRKDIDKLDKLFDEWIAEKDVLN